MGGAVVMIVVLVVFPVLVLISGAVGACVVGLLLKLDRDSAYAATEYLALSESDSYRR